MGIRLGFYALIVVVGFVTAGLALISQGSQRQGTSASVAIAAPLTETETGDSALFNFNGNHNDNCFFDCNDNNFNQNHNDNCFFDCNNNGNHNHNGNGNDNDDDEDNDNGDEDNQNEGDSGDPFAHQASGGTADVGCATAGSDKSFGSADGRITVHVLPTMSRNVHFSIANPIDASSVPSTPGQKVDALLFRVSADDCGGGGIGTLPNEFNLGVRYSDQDASGMTEANFKIAWLDPADNTWKPLPKQAPDPGANYVSATIMNTGYFVVYQ